MTKQTSQFGCGYLQTAQEVTESLISNLNHAELALLLKLSRVYLAKFKNFKDEKETIAIAKTPGCK